MECKIELGIPRKALLDMQESVYPVSSMVMQKTWDEIERIFAGAQWDRVCVKIDACGIRGLGDMPQVVCYLQAQVFSLFEEAMKKAGRHDALGNPDLGYWRAFLYPPCAYSAEIDDIIRDDIRTPIEDAHVRWMVPGRAPHLINIKSRTYTGMKNLFLSTLNKLNDCAST